MENQKDCTTPKTYFQSPSEFVRIQRLLLESEQQTEVIESEQLLVDNTTFQLEKLGLCINKVKLQSIKGGLYGRLLLTFTHPNYSNKVNDSTTFANMVKLPETRISGGDNVGVFRQTPHLAGASALIRGVVYKKNQYQIVVTIDGQGQFEQNQIGNDLMCLVQQVNQVTYKRYMRVLDKLEELSNGDPNHPSRNLIRVLLEGQNPKVQSLCQRTHIYDGKRDNLKFNKQDLNEQQKEAVKFSLSQENISLIHGPPGTGKTMTVCEIIYQAVSFYGMKVLATAGSNIAVDNIVERLNKKGINVCRIGHPARMLKTIYENCLDYKVRQTSLFKEIKEIKNNINKTLKKIASSTNQDEKRELKNVLRELRSEMRNHQKMVVKQVLDESSVICCTNAGADDKVFQRELQGYSFDLVVIDECAQAVEVSCWIPILRGRRLVLAGDHLQLPPTVKSKTKYGPKDISLSLTLFDRTLQSFPEDLVSKQLKVQYRMNSKIMKWSSDAVYKGSLVADGTVANHTLRDLTDTKEEREIQREDVESVLLFIDTAGSNMGQSCEVSGGAGQNEQNKSKSNIGEADLVRIVYQELILQGINSEDIGIIAPYNAQVDLVRKQLEKNGVDTQKTEVSTVDGFQGREKECIIISLTRSNPLQKVGFLNDFRRMNVAVTRAKRFVALIGDSQTVSSDPFLKQLVNYFEVNGELRHADEYQGQDDVRFGMGFVFSDKTQMAAERLKDGSGSVSTKEKTVTNKEERQENKKKNKKNAPQTDPSVVGQEETKKQQIGEFPIIQETEEQIQQKLHSQEEEDQLREKYAAIVDTFMKDPKRQELKFNSIAGFERKILHQMAEELQLIHESKGNGKDKEMILKKTKIHNLKANQQKKQDQVVAKPDSKEVDKMIDGMNAQKELNEISQKQNNDEVNKKLIELNEKQSDDLEEEEPSQKIEEQKTESIEETKNNVGESQQKKNKKPAKKKQADDDLDDMAFLDKLIEENKTCHFRDSKQIKCQSIVGLIGTNCKYCGRRFCIKHGTPQQHGCEDLARVVQREQFKNVVNQQLRGEKPLTAQKEGVLQHILQDKINKAAEARKPKEKQKEGKK